MFPINHNGSRKNNLRTHIRKMKRSEERRRKSPHECESRINHE